MLIDISPPITAALAVWPGDTPVSRELLADLRRGDNLTLSTLRATVHLGAHADGPNHYGATAPGIGERPLDFYVGPCAVVQLAAPRGQRVSIDAVRAALDKLCGGATSPRTVTRLLIATGTYPDPTRFNEDFAALEPALIDWLAGLGVRTVGIDTPSVDLFSSKELPAHARFLANDMAILEGLVLTDVPAGEYELIAAPLRLMGFDASPVRALLRRA